MMTDLPPSASPPAKPLRGRYRRHFWAGTAGILLLVLLSYWLGRAALVRNRTIAALQSLGMSVQSLHVSSVTPWSSQIDDLVAGPQGALKVAHIRVTYGPGRLFQKQVDRISLTGLEVSADSLRGLSGGQGSDAEPIFPFSVIELADSTLHIGSGENALAVPIRGSLTHEGGQLRLSGQADLKPKPLKLWASFKGKDRAGAVECEALESSTVRQVLEGLGIHLPEMTGWAATRVAFAMQDEAGSITATLQPQAIALTTDEGTKFNVEKGLITFIYNFGGQADGQLNLSGLNINSSTADVWAEGITGAVSISGFSPLITPAAQQLSVARLTSGKVRLYDGTVALQAKAGGEIAIEQTQWQGLGGTIAAENAVFSMADQAVDMNVVVKNIALRDLLEAIGQGKAAGEGRVSATVPLQIARAQIALGEGSVSAEPGGTIKIYDTSAITNAVHSADARVARDLPTALADFEFQTLRADIRKGEDGLRAEIRLAGKGRLQQTLPYDLEFRLSPINDALAIALGVQRVLQGK